MECEHLKEVGCIKNICTCNTGPKQETLEEAVKKYCIEKYSIWTSNGNESNDFINGAKWQQERSYSKEEVYNIIQQLRLQLKTGVLKWQDDFEFDLDKWFEQFKRK